MFPIEGQATRIAHKTGLEDLSGQNVAFFAMQQSHRDGPC